MLIPFKTSLFASYSSVYLFYTSSLCPKSYDLIKNNNISRISFKRFFGTHHAKRNGTTSFSNKKQITFKNK